MNMKMLLISQHASVSIILVLMTICCMKSHATVSFYKADAHFTSRFSGPNIPKLSAEVLELGPTFPDPPKGFDGMVVLSDPEDGCQAIAPPPNATGINPFGKWVAFMKMGNCDVTVKTRNAQNANYHMALIDNGLHIFFCGITEYDRNANTSDIKINTVVVPYMTGMIVKSEGLYDKGMVMNVMKDYQDNIDCERVRDRCAEGTDDYRLKRRKIVWKIECRSRNTGEIVPIPDTWTV